VQLNVVGNFSRRKCSRRRPVVLEWADHQCQTTTWTGSLENSERAHLAHIVSGRIVYCRSIEGPPGA